MKITSQQQLKPMLRSFLLGRITFWLHSLGLFALLYFIIPVTNANTLKSVDYAKLPGERIEITLTLSSPIDLPKAFATESPARIAIDLPGVISELNSKALPIGVGSVHSLIAVEGSDKTRVVLNLIDPSPYKVSSSGNQIFIRVENPDSFAVEPAPPQAPSDSISNLNQPSSAQEPSQTASPPAWSYPRRSSEAMNKAPPVKDIDFRRGVAGEGRVIIHLPSSDTRVAVREQESRVYVDLYNTSLPQRLFRQLDVLDFGTPVKFIETRPNGSNILVEVQTDGNFDYMAYQTDEIFALDFRSLTAAEKEEILRRKAVYDGERLTLNFQDIEVRAVLQLLADFTDLNIVASDSVKGNITLRLKNVPWDQALDIILKTRNLGQRRDGNVILIAPTAELAKSEQLQMEAEQRFEELSPLRTEFINIKYAKASELVGVINGTVNTKNVYEHSSSSSARGKSKFDSYGGSGVAQGKFESSSSGTSSSHQENTGGILSFRGKVTADERTNTLIVQDTLKNIEEIRRLVNLLDVPVRQVMIESRVVIANNDFTRNLGVRFGVSGSMGSLNGNELLIAGGQDGNLALSGFDTGPFGLNTGTGTAYNSTLTDDSGNTTLITNLPAAGAAGSINFLLGKVGSYLLQLELSAMQREGRGEIISSPRVITSDQSSATISVGSEIPYQESSQNSSTNTVAFKKAVLELNVTPHITSDDRIMMDLKVNKDAPDFSNLVNGVPPVDTRSVETNVLVDNGETVVLGGVYEREKSFNKEQVPWLGDVPVLGRLFKNESRQDNNSELLIFVTPKILESNIVQP